MRTKYFIPVLLLLLGSILLSACDVVGASASTSLGGITPMYTLSVAQGGYACSYTGYTQGRGQLAPVTMIDVAARSRLSPHQPSVSSQGYAIGYAPDSLDRACPMTADAADSANNVIPGSASSSALGVYLGPATNSLAGAGTILLQRTCSWTLHNPFDTMSLTYQSTASVAVTWSH